MYPKTISVDFAAHFFPFMFGAFLLEIEDAFILRFDKEIYISTYINNNFI